MVVEVELQIRTAGAPGAVVALLYVSAALSPMFAAVLTGIEATGAPSEFATALGLTAAALLLLQFLSSGRFESISGRMGIDRTMGFHRIAAYVLLAFATLHPLLYLSSTLFADPIAAWHRLLGMLASPRLRTGVIALAGLFAIVWLATIRARPFMRYERWRFTHGPLAIVVAGLILHHAVTAGAYSAETVLRIVWFVLAAAAAAAALLVYVVRPWRMWREDWRVERVRRVGERVVEMILRGPPTTQLRFRAGQFIWMTLAPKRPPFHDHPFSIASSSADLPRLRLVINEVGDCTRTFEGILPGTPVAVDGPHGSFCLPPNASQVILIAGGVGIAPLLGILEEGAARRDAKPYRLLYAVRKQSGLVLKDRLRELQSQLDLSISYIVDDDPRQADCEAGPLRASFVKRLVGASNPRSAVALICGPPRMMEVAADALLDAGVPPASIYYERFDYGAGKGRLDRARQRQALAVFLALVVAMTTFSLR
jgi:predicted ferric reductase